MGSPPVVMNNALCSYKQVEPLRYSGYKYMLWGIYLYIGSEKGAHVYGWVLGENMGAHHGESV